MTQRLTQVRKLDLLQRVAEALLGDGMLIGEAMEEFHRALLGAALEAENNNQCHVAKKHKIHRNTLHRQMVELGLDYAGRRRGRASKALPTSAPVSRFEIPSAVEGDL